MRHFWGFFDVRCPRSPFKMTIALVVLPRVTFTPIFGFPVFFVSELRGSTGRTDRQTDGRTDDCHDL